MSFGTIGTLGTGISSTSTTSFSFTTATNALVAGNFGILVLVSENTGTTDGDNTEHTTVSGGTGTWTRLGEYSNTDGVANAGVVVSVWLFEATGTLAIGTTITLNFSPARLDKCCSFWGFTKTGASIIVSTEPPTNPLTSAVDAAVNFGSSAFSSLTSAERLYFRGLGKYVNTTTGITVSSGFTAITPTRSRNNADAVIVRGEFRINTSTGETSNPTLAVVGNTAGLFFALIEQGAILGSLSKTLDAVVVSAQGALAIKGVLSKTLDAVTLSAQGNGPGAQPSFSFTVPVEPRSVSVGVEDRAATVRVESRSVNVPLEAA